MNKLYTIFSCTIFLISLLYPAQKSYADANCFPSYALVKFTGNMSYDMKIALMRQNPGLLITDEVINEININEMVVPLADGYAENFEAVARAFRDEAAVEYVSPFYVVGTKYAITYSNEFFVKLKSSGDVKLLKELAAKMNILSYKESEFLHDVYILKASKTGDGDAKYMADYFNKSGYFKYAQPNYMFTPEVGSANQTDSVNDPLYKRQWNTHNNGSILQGSGTPHADMKVDSAWTITTGSPTVKIAIIDSGTDTNHLDLKDNILQGFDATDTNLNNHNSYPRTAYPDDGHGTCTSGIVGAKGNNGIGIAGVAYNCRIIPVHVFYYIPPPFPIPGYPSNIPWSTSAWFVNGITWAWKNAHADVLSNSWGVPDTLLHYPLFVGQDLIVNEAIFTAVDSGRGGKGAPMFFSSGNDGGPPLWPSRLPQVIGVNATSMCDQRKSPTSCDGENWWGSNWGDSSDISAPGVRIPSTDMLGTHGFSSNDYYYFFNGTSAACPNAAAVMALIFSINDTLTLTHARNIIESTCDTVGGYNYSTIKSSGHWSKELGYGRVNAYRAARKAQATLIVPPTAVNTNIVVYYDKTTHRTVLHYALGAGATVQVEVYNILGEKIGVSHYENAAKGEYEELLNDGTLTAGIYFARLLVNGHYATRKFVAYKQ